MKEKDYRYSRTENLRIDDVEATQKRNSDESKNDKIDDRDEWSHRFDFLFSCISLSVGLGNVWRFPYLCYKNGGGAFLVCYFISMITCGIPLFFQEIAIGQYLGSGGMTLVGKICPILGGTGYAAMTIVFLLDVYYCVICAWTLFYLGSCIWNFFNLPWEHCNNSWNSVLCSTDVIYKNGSSISESQLSFLNSSETNKSSVYLGNTSLIHQSGNFINPAEEYWTRRVLKLTSGIEEIGGIQWELLCTLCISWLVIYLILGKGGLSQSGKIIWFTALAPYIVIIALLVRSVTLRGADQGFYYLISTDWNKLKSPETWIEGVTQTFYGYSLGVGTLPAFGSYNRFNHNSYRDSVITCIINTITCIFCSVITFCILGFMADIEGTTVEDVVDHGPGLVFITYPEVVLKLPASSLWAVVFFFMLALIGIDSEFCNVESFIAGLVDKWSSTLRPKRRQFTFAVCLVMLFLGTPMVTHGGMYVFQLFDFYCASGLPLLWVCFFQTIAISWVFGVERFNNCIYQMLGFHPNLYLTICWVYCAPLVMFSVFAFFVFKFEAVKYEKYTYPAWGNIFGISLSLISMMWIPLYAIYYLYNEEGSLLERFKKGLTPTVDVLSISNDVTDRPEELVSEKSQISNHNEKPDLVSPS